MDRELEQQIDELIQKSTNDLKTKLSRVIIRYKNKLLKDQARDLKGPPPSTSRKVMAPSTSKNTFGNSGTFGSSKDKPSKKNRYHSDSDSDRYYSD